MPRQLPSIRMRCALAAALLCAGPVVAAEPEPAPLRSAVAGAEAIDKAIRATAQQFVNAFKRGDAKAIAALWTAAGTMTDEAGQTFTGREAIEQQYAAFFAASPGAELMVSIKSIQVVTPQLAIEDGVASVIAGNEVPSASRYTAVHVLDGDHWRMAAVRESHLEIPAGAVGVGDLEWLLGNWQVEEQGKQVELTFAWTADRAFIEGTHIVREGDKVTFEGKQIIGYDPRAGAIAVWVFNSDGSLASGLWAPHPTGWTITLSGTTADGVETQAVNTLSRVGDALVWKSIRRSVGGRPLADTTEAILKRKP